MTFPLQYGAFAFNTPPVTRQCASASHHPVARYGDGKSVCGTCPRHRTHGIWRSDPLGNIRIARRCTSRNFFQCLPHTLLKCGSSNFERQMKSESRSFDKADYLRDETLEFLVPPTSLARG